MVLVGKDIAFGLNTEICHIADVPTQRSEIRLCPMSTIKFKAAAKNEIVDSMI